MRVATKRFLAPIACAALSMALLSCSSSEPPVAEAEGEAESEPAAETESGTATDADVMSSITVGFNSPSWANQAATQLAISRGYFADEGITDVEIIVTEDFVPGLIGGGLDIVEVADSDAIIGSAEASGEELVWLASYHNYEYHILGAAPGIEDASELQGGQATGGGEGSRNDMLVRRMLTELGLEAGTDVEMVPMGGGSDARLQAVMQGTVDAASLFPRHIAPLEEAGGTIVYSQAHELPQTGIAVHGDMLASERATVVAFLKATLRARQDLHDLARQDENIEELRAQGLEITDDFAALYEMEIEQISPDGGFTPSQFDELIQDAVALGNLPEGIDWRAMVDLGPLHEAQAALGLTTNPAGLD